MANYCPNCGRGVGVNDSYCPDCGSPLNITSCGTTAVPHAGTSHSTLLGIAEILTGLWAILALLLGILMLAGSSIINDSVFFIVGSTLSFSFFLAALFAGLAANNIRKRKHAKTTMVLLILSGIFGLGWIYIAIGVVMAVIVLMSENEFTS
ncbi:MAG: zinc ribbon domain-containing protein [archaeon]|nr:zinc ribbon domain-containing protein [archaeon]